MSSTPTRSAPINAPRIEPMPPMMTTTRVVIRIGSPIPDCTETSGTIIIPASPAKTPPSAKIRV